MSERASESEQTVHGLPWYPNRLVGRDDDIAAIVDMYAEESPRILTLTGPGGVGKTRLAVAVAPLLSDQFPDGVYFVDLAAVQDWRMVATAIVLGTGQRPAAALPADRQLEEWAADRSALLILDSFEHVLSAADLLSRIVRQSRGLSLLVTSRSALRLGGEQDFAVLPLVAGNAGDDAALTSPAFDLFVERARAVRPDLVIDGDAMVSIASIVKTLDGLPLAIELAAARSRHLSPQMLEERLSSTLPLLTGGARDQPLRLQTMREAIGWSYNMLEEDEQQLLQKLAVFSGGFTFEAAEQVSGERGIFEVLASLVENSLVGSLKQPGDAARFGMLETVREFALEQFEASQGLVEARNRHAAWIGDEAARTRDDLYQEDLSIVEYLAWGEAEQHNVRAALGWCLESEEYETGMLLAGSFGVYWAWRGQYQEGISWVSQLRVKAPDDASRGRARALETLGVLSGMQGDHEMLRSSLEAVRAMDGQIESDSAGEIAMLLRLGITAEDAGDYDGAEALFQQSLELAEAADHSWFRAVALTHLGIVAFGKGDFDRSRTLLEQAVRVAVGKDDPVTRFVAPLFLGMAGCEQGRLDEASTSFADCVRALDLSGGLVTARSQAPESFVRLLMAVGTLAIELGEMTSAARLFGASGRVRDQTGMVLALPERDVYERDLERVRSDLGAVDFEQAWRTGYGYAAEEVVRCVDRILSQGGQQSGVGIAADVWGLSAREQEILLLVSDGLTDAQIAEQLFISPRTVSKHVGNILAKMGVSSRVEAASRAVGRTPGGRGRLPDG